MKHVLLTVVFLGIACVAMAHELSSPNGNLKLNVVLDSEGGPVYSLYYKGEPVVEPSALGILMEEADLSNGFRILDATNSTFDETHRENGDNYPAGLLPSVTERASLHIEPIVLPM
jgi:glucan 1,4-alpha-glucosidase